MEKRTFLLSVMLVVALCGSAAFALDPMGPPTAGLKKGQFSAGADYSYSKMDLKLNEGRWSDIFGYSGELPSGKIKNLEMNKVYANLGYGIMDNWEMFLRLGAANAEFKTTLFDLGGVRKDFDGDTGFAIGFGTKATLYEQNNLKLGGLFQISWAEPDVKATGPGWSESIDIDITEIQIAAGPIYQLMPGVSIYGGPFFHLIDGDADAKLHNGGTTKRSYDIDQASYFGGYIGTQFNLGESLALSAEWQHTDNADAIAASAIYRF